MTDRHRTGMEPETFQPAPRVSESDNGDLFAGPIVSATADGTALDSVSPKSILAEFETYLDAYRNAILAEENAGPEYAGTDPDVDRAWERVNGLGTPLRGRMSAHEATIAGLRRTVQRMRSAFAVLDTNIHEAFDAWDSDNDSRCGKLLAALSGSSRSYRVQINEARDAFAEPAPTVSAQDDSAGGGE